MSALLGRQNISLPNRLHFLSTPLARLSRAAPFDGNLSRRVVLSEQVRGRDQVLDNRPHTPGFDREQPESDVWPEPRNAQVKILQNMHLKRVFRQSVLQSMKEQFTYDATHAPWDDIRECQALFPLSTLYTYEFLKTTSAITGNPNFCRRLEVFQFQLREWRDWPLITFVMRTFDVLAVFSEVMDCAVNPVRITFNNVLWQDMIAQALVHDMEDMSRALQSVVNQEDVLNLSYDQLQCMVDIVQLVIDSRAAGSRAFDRFLKTTAEKVGILPSYIFMTGIQRIGQHAVHGGGFADVWLGQLDGERLALKVLRVFSPIDRDKIRAEICQEAMVWRRLDHPNVLPFLGICPDEFAPQLALVSRWMIHGDLSSFLAEHPDADCRQMIEGVASGLHYLHTMTPQIIHGDLRAANVLIDENYEPRITDFGLSRVIYSQASPALTMSFHGKGTLRWQAPELLVASRFDGEVSNITNKSDVYAFGCLCLEVFTGQVPFPKLLDGAVIMEVVQGRRPSRPGSFATSRGLDDNIWDIMKWCWKDLPIERPIMSWVVERLRGTDTIQHTIPLDRSGGRPESPMRRSNAVRVPRSRSSSVLADISELYF